MVHLPWEGWKRVVLILLWFTIVLLDQARCFGAVQFACLDIYCIMPCDRSYHVYIMRS